MSSVVRASEVVGVALATARKSFSFCRWYFVLLLKINKTCSHQRDNDAGKESSRLVWISRRFDNLHFFFSLFLLKREHRWENFIRSTEAIWSSENFSSFTSSSSVCVVVGCWVWVSQLEKKERTKTEEKWKIENEKCEMKSWETLGNRHTMFAIHLEIDDKKWDFFANCFNELSSTDCIDSPVFFDSKSHVPQSKHVLTCTWKMKMIKSHRKQRINFDEKSIKARNACIIYNTTKKLSPLQREE